MKPEGGRGGRGGSRGLQVGAAAWGGGVCQAGRPGGNFSGTLHAWWLLWKGSSRARGCTMGHKKALPAVAHAAAGVGALTCRRRGNCRCQVVGGVQPSACLDARGPGGGFSVPALCRGEHTFTLLMQPQGKLPAPPARGHPSALPGGTPAVQPAHRTQPYLCRCLCGTSPSPGTRQWSHAPHPSP